MTKREIRKLATLVKNNTQKEAVYAALEQGFQPSVQDLHAAGIADPRRVVNKLRRDHGISIEVSQHTKRFGESVNRYFLRPQTSKRSSKRKSA